PVSPHDSGSKTYFKIDDPGVKDFLGLQNTATNRSSSLQDTDRQLVLATPPDRSRFYGQDYVGLRFKVHYKDGNLDDLAPSSFDISFGNNAALNGGCLTCGGVFHKALVTRLDWYYSLPIEQLKAFHIFGTAFFKFSQGASTTPFLTAPITDPNDREIAGALVVVSPESRRDRDMYRIGFGVDIGKLIKHEIDSVKNSTNKAAQ